MQSFMLAVIPLRGLFQFFRLTGRFIQVARNIYPLDAFCHLLSTKLTSTHLSYVQFLQKSQHMSNKSSSYFELIVYFQMTLDQKQTNKKHSFRWKLLI